MNWKNFVYWTDVAWVIMGTLLNMMMTVIAAGVIELEGWKLIAFAVVYYLWLLEVTWARLQELRRERDEKE